MTDETTTTSEPEVEAPKIPRLCTLKPLGGQIIIKRDPPVTVTKGGIVLPAESGIMKKVTTGVVVRKGPGHVAPQTGQRLIISEDIKPGARVMFMQMAGGDYPHEEAHGDEVYTMMQEAEILCVIDTFENGVPIPESVVTQEELSAALEQDAKDKVALANEARKKMEQQAERMANQLSGKSGGGLVRPR